MLISFLICFTVQAQEKLYPNMFPLKDVSLLNGPFKHARDLNIQTLLKYDVDRLLAPYLKEAGLVPKGESYKNWEGLDGHIGGHYLAALAMNYAATNNAECKRRMDYMITELKACQDANTKNHGEWGKGYVGGAPNSAEIWSTLKKGDFKAYRGGWVPWYNVHKMYAGLRDAWLYGGSNDAKDIFIKFCDWSIDVTAGLSEEQMQQILDVEPGGMNEMFADAYQITGDKKYLTTAKRFSHKSILDPLVKGVDNLDNKHANTQVPKAIGFERIGELAGDQQYKDAGSFFWETVTKNRTLAFGGNSRREFFPSVASSIDFVNDVEGPETCNSYNMLKLTQDLFRLDPSAKYIDFYEKALYNHILSTQHPEHGGYVYFTPARPRHYRVYSAPNEGMWCCVGSGMENHGKYNEFIYTHQNDSLFLNLFIASKLNWAQKGITLKQETNFPDEAQSKLTITGGKSKFTLMIRYPNWVKAGTLGITVNGKAIKISQSPSSYVAINRLWKKGDVVELKLPMQTTVEHMPNIPVYASIMRGPILLSAKTGQDELKGLVADDSRWGHIAGGKKLAVDKAPIIVDDHPDKISERVAPLKGENMKFQFVNEKIINPEKLVLEPFYKIHDSRYMMYWMMLSNKQYGSYLDSVSSVEKEKLELQNRTVDFVAPGEQQPEVDHAMQTENSRKGVSHDQFFREANKGGYFSYSMATNSLTNLSLYVRYWGAEWGNRDFELYIDDEKLTTVKNTRRWELSLFQSEEYKIPETMLKGKKSIRVKFKALPDSTAGAVYYVRLLTNK
ncbi:beta-L-arabinofuranosidase domain-containing protein [Pedobacter alpinus]|uniref:Beta-L-arabinofuranosidase domain-containing protein n=1 Tax=Pedobacter alpinus TaxID=1590643 RepID=A0ABW5TWI5_9SPHI